MVTIDGGLNGDSDIPVVSLSVSNPAPQVNDQVMLTCTIISGDSTGAIFDFQPVDGRLIVNRATGIALLIVSESDLGAALTYTCTATNENGTSPSSGSVVVIPTSGVGPETMSAPTGVSSGTPVRP